MVWSADACMYQGPSRWHPGMAANQPTRRAPVCSPQNHRHHAVVARLRQRAAHHRGCRQGGQDGVHGAVSSMALQPVKRSWL